jgi:hypothetical protein
MVGEEKRSVQVISHRENLRGLLDFAHLQDRSSLFDEERDVIF